MIGIGALGVCGIIVTGGVSQYSHFPLFLSFHFHAIVSFRFRCELNTRVDILPTSSLAVHYPFWGLSRCLPSIIPLSRSSTCLPLVFGSIFHAGRTPFLLHGHSFERTG